MRLVKNKDLGGEDQVCEETREVGKAAQELFLKKDATDKFANFPKKLILIKKDFA